MAEINCNVARDLIPLHIDGVLSDDSRRLVEEHLAECPECREYAARASAAETVVSPKAIAEDKAAIVGIRRKLRRRRVLTICLTALIVLGIAAGAVWALAVKESYVPYEKSGLYVEDGVLKCDLEEYKWVCFEDADGESLYICFCSTALEEMRARKTTDPHEESRILLNDPKLQDAQSVYYLSAEAYGRLMNGKKETDWDNIRENSTLIWEK